MRAVYCKLYNILIKLHKNFAYLKKNAKDELTSFPTPS